MKKREALDRWHESELNQDPLPHMTAIPYKSEGSRFGTCGIRIDGNPEFVDAVLSNLKTLLDGENEVTRLGLSRTPVKPTEINGETKTYELADEQAEVCYVRLHERGSAAKQVNVLFNTHPHKHPSRKHARKA